MKMMFWQKAYDWIKSWSAPRWFIDLMGEVQAIFLATLYQIGKAQLEAIKAKIIEIAKDSDLSNEQKFKAVFSFAKGININLKDSVLNALINALVLGLKNKGII